jgi:hypothetical protein
MLKLITLKYVRNLQLYASSNIDFNDHRHSNNRLPAVQAHGAISDFPQSEFFSNGPMTKQQTVNNTNDTASMTTAYLHPAHCFVLFRKLYGNLQNTTRTTYSFFNLKKKQISESSRFG